MTEGAAGHGEASEKIAQFREAFAELSICVTPVKTGVQKSLKDLDSDFRRNDVKGLLQEALKYLSSRRFRGSRIITAHF
jgi:hypothetical protein